jgi:hypothetical protein
LAGKVLNGPPLAGVTGQIAYAPGDRVPAQPVAIHDAARLDRAMLQLTPAVVPAP